MIKSISIIEIRPLTAVRTKKFTMTTEREYWKQSRDKSKITAMLLIFQMDMPRQSQMYLRATAFTAFCWSECRSTF